MAALDFPNSPTTNQVFTSGGSSWTWDGVKWIVSAGPGGKPLISGNNLSDVASVPTSRANLGLGTMAVQNAASVAITGGAITSNTIDGSPIGGTTPSSAAFTTMSASGNATVGGALTVTGTATFGGAVTVNNTLTVNNVIHTTNTITSGGAGDGGFLCYDRASPYTAQAMLYRSGTGSYLWMNDYGNVITCGNNGTASCALDWTVGRNLTVSGTTLYCSALTTWGANFYAAGGYSLEVTNPSGTNNYIQYTINGVRSWYSGQGSDQVFRLYDATAGHTHFSGNPTNNQILLGGGTTIATDNTTWGSPMIRSYTVNGYVPDGIGSSTNISGYNAYDADVSNGNSNLMFFTTNNRATGVGTITTNGTNTFYNTSCDGRRKKNMRPLTKEIDVSAMIDAIEPVAFEWTHLPDEPTGYGFVAQDLYKVVGEHVVRKGFDDVDLQPWGADLSKLVPYMVAEMQQMRKRIAELEASHG